jgi:hypothetical protein
MDARATIALFRRTFGRACLVVGPCFLAIALGFALHTWVFLNRSQGTTARIVGMVSTRYEDQDSVGFAPVFTFTAIDGHSYTVTSDVFAYPPEYVVGQRVPVLYEKTNPVRARLDSFWQLWLFPFAFGLIGGLGAGTGYLLLLYDRRVLVQASNAG